MHRTMKALGVALTLLACGRTGTLLPGQEPQQPQQRESPLFVFTGDLCPDAGIEADLVPQKSDGLALVKMTAQGECSGAGGEWLIGRELGTTRDFFVGSHACYFQPRELMPQPAEYFAVVRYMQTAALFKAPMGWCITDANGKEPVTTDSKNIAWGIYASEAAARAAYEHFRE